MVLLGTAEFYFVYIYPFSLLFIFTVNLIICVIITPASCSSTQDPQQMASAVTWGSTRVTYFQPLHRQQHHSTDINPAHPLTARHPHFLLLLMLGIPTLLLLLLSFIVSKRHFFFALCRHLIWSNLYQKNTFSLC